MPDITPGQIAHAAFVAAEHGGPVPPERVALRWRCLLPSEQRGWEAAAQAVRADIHDALAFAVRYGQIDGAHHKAWVIDQMCRALLGTEEAYIQFVAEACAGEDGPHTYGWDEGIAP